MIVLCDLQTKENGYTCNCPKLQSDDWDELEDCCENCVHKIWKKIDEEGGVE